MIGVQWHPERSLHTSAASLDLFRGFCRGSRKPLMTPLTEQRVAELLQPYAEAGCGARRPLCEGGDLVSELLLRWNARTNLTAVREPELLVQRQIGESVFAAQLLQTAESLLDVGSGAGFPGIPSQADAA